MAAKKINGGSNCLAAQVVVLPGEDKWPQQGEFLRLLNAEVAKQPTARAYYPGARARRDELLEMCGLDTFGSDVDDVALIDLTSTKWIPRYACRWAGVRCSVPAIPLVMCLPYDPPTSPNDALTTPSRLSTTAPTTAPQRLPTW